MPYDQVLAGRIRDRLTGLPGLEEKKMFGGVGFLLRGNMACGVHGDDMIVRVGQDEFEASLSQPGARPFDLTGRPMAGWVTVASASLAADSDLKRWIELGVKFAQSLPPK
jgi:TfoX/Sxy family transcriptional regulator of competence genes